MLQLTRWLFNVSLMVTFLWPSIGARMMDANAMDNLLSECDFQTNTCHLRNQHNLAKFNRFHNDLKQFFNRNSFLLLNMNSPRVQRYPGARLISSYYPSKYNNACLYISYRFAGPGMERFYVIQQDDDNRCVYVGDRTNSLENVWNEIQLQLDLSQGDCRFFMEIHFNPDRQQRQGFFAIGQFSFGYGNCLRRTVNHCYDQLVNQHINVAPTANR